MKVVAVMAVAAAVAASCARTILFQAALPPRLRLAMKKAQAVRPKKIFFIPVFYFLEINEKRKRMYRDPQ